MRRKDKGGEKLFDVWQESVKNEACVRVDKV